MERVGLLELAFLLWGEESEAEARVATVLRHRDADTAVRALLRTRAPSMVSAVRTDPWWVAPEVAARAARTAQALAGLPLPDRAAAVLVGLGAAQPAELPARFGLPAVVPAVLGPDPQGALADRLAVRHPPARDDDQAAAGARAARRRHRARVGAVTAGALVVGVGAWLVPRPAAVPDPTPVGATPSRPATLARLASLGPTDTPGSLAAGVAVDAAAASAGVPVESVAAAPVWSGQLDTGIAGVVDAVVVRVVLPDGTALSSTAFAQGRENQAFLVAPCGVQPAGAVTAARCSSADAGTGVTATTVLLTGLTGPATLLRADGVPLAALTPDAGGTTTVRDDAGAGTRVRLSDGTEVAVTSP